MIPIIRYHLILKKGIKMAIFKLYDCDVGLTLNGVNYDFTHVVNIEIEDPERQRLTRGANAGNKTGISYREGLKEAKTVTYTVIGMPLALHNLLKEAFKNGTRMDAYIISRVDGSSKIAKNAVLAQAPKQMTLDDSPDSMNTQLIFESFDIDEVHKSDA